MTSTRAVFVEAALGGLALVETPAVGRAWGSPSALGGMTVGALAAHLARQVARVPEVLAFPVPEERPVSLVEHYGRSAWVVAGVDDEPNVDIRTRAAGDAAIGQAAVLEQAGAALAQVRDALPTEPPQRLVRPPRTGWNLTLDDYLRSRVLEIVVHSDDLVCSVGLEPPVWSQDVVAPVLGLLTTLSVRRYGYPAVLRALARRERAPETIAAI